MGQIPSLPSSDEAANRDVSVKAYEVKDDYADESPPIDTTSSFDPTVDEPKEETSSTSAVSATPTYTPTEAVSTFASFLNLSPIEAVKAMVKRVDDYNRLAVEAAQHAISAKASGQTLGEIEYAITEITQGMNKTIDAELALFNYLLQVLNANETNKILNERKDLS